MQQASLVFRCGLGSHAELAKAALSEVEKLHHALMTRTRMFLGVLKFFLPIPGLFLAGVRVLDTNSVP